MKNRISAARPTSLPRAKRSLGQNFLVDRTFVEKIVAALGPGAGDTVFEIGPGQGALTRLLVERARKVVALEFDRELAEHLRKTFADYDNFRLIEDDALRFDFGEIDAAAGTLRVIANLPYNISTAVLQRLFDHESLLADAVLMFQREVVERITAPPSTKDRGYLTVLTEAFFSVERLFDVPPSAFRPVPRIWSSVVRLTPKRTPPANPDLFRELVARGFAQKR
ncbi:MAG TPA: 16S rRNA (adenine(1518)-N(6)/adenine(1519)-N(6))-dimethyltransferase RsmA, partial [Pyrinomonadaceae bacterium]|nr:16S rRNA (adenine(1518)-N(6)/adenine(1519)-N(6))-dimethyltransferase RsmA [Pyrinomonadaceae bacterium]